MKFGKRLLAVVLAIVTIFCAQTFVAIADENPVKILFLGNSLVYYNKMDTEMFPELCKSLGKNVEVDSITESGCSLFRFQKSYEAYKDKVEDYKDTEEKKKPVGVRLAEHLASKQYDYIILQPSRHVSPFNYNVLEVEEEAALKLNVMFNELGSKTLLLASPGVNTGEIEVCRIDEEKFQIVETGYFPVDRKAHQFQFESLCEMLIGKMENADMVRVGAASELVMDNFPSFNSLYRKDNRHPSVRGSYLQACCIYAKIFGETPVGAGYTDSIYNQNAIVLQRAAAIAVLGESEDIFKTEESTFALSGEMWSNSEINLYWDHSKIASYYEVYRKLSSDKTFELIGRTVSNECGFVDKTAKAGNTYVYKVKPYYTIRDLTFETNNDETVSFVTLAKPNKPSATLVNKTTVKLNFKAVESAQFYSVYRKAQDGKTFMYIGSTIIPEFVDDSLTAGSTYTYYVVAEKENGAVVSKPSANRKVFVAGKPKVKAKSSGGNVTLTIKSVKGANKYAIYYKKSSESEYKYLTLTSDLTYTITGLSKGVKYNFKVRACKDKDSSTTAGLFRTKTIKVK